MKRVKIRDEPNEGRAENEVAKSAPIDSSNTGMKLPSTSGPGEQGKEPAATASGPSEPLPHADSVDDVEVKPKKSRKLISFQEKYFMIEKYYEFQDKNGEASFRDLEEEFGVPKSTLQRWIRDQDDIAAKAADETLKSLTRVYPSRKNRHAATYAPLYTEFRNARKVGKKVSFVWLWVKGMKIAHEKELPLFTRSATQVFIEKYGIRMRTVQRKKQHDKKMFEPKLRDFLLNYREGVIKSGHMKPHYDEKWGRFRPSRRFNVDQGGNSIDILDFL